MEIIFENDWMQIKKTNGRYVIQYDSGAHFDNIKETEVSEEDAILAQKSEEEAEKVIIKYQNIEMGLI
ncbi:MAG: hypothetical protein FWH04_09480 [Oscillospiraceae bacterium]|nr:hypothetical protein [Oscillospiraceae bacterium]